MSFLGIKPYINGKIILELPFKKIHVYIGLQKLTEI